MEARFLTNLLSTSDINLPLTVDKMIKQNQNQTIRFGSTK